MSPPNVDGFARLVNLLHLVSLGENDALAEGGHVARFGQRRSP